MRTVIRSQRFERDCLEVNPNVRRVDEILEGVEWAIAQRADNWPLVNGTGFRAIKTACFPDAPTLLVLFTIEGPCDCVLQRLLVAPDESEDGF